MVVVYVCLFVLLRSWHPVLMCAHVLPFSLRLRLQRHSRTTLSWRDSAWNLIRSEIHIMIK